MIIRATLMYCSLLLSLDAQQRAVNIEVHAVGFPDNYTIKTEVGLNYRVHNIQQIATEGRTEPTTDDRLMDMRASRTHSWDISFDKEGTAAITGSPLAVAYSFQRPLNQISNATAVLTIDGKTTIYKDGEVKSNRGHGQTSRFINDTTYVLLLSYRDLGKDKGEEIPLISQYFFPKDEMQDALNGTGKFDRKQLEAQILQKWEEIQKAESR